MIDLLKLQVVTEKSFLLSEENKYIFQVDVQLNKKQIKRIFEHLFDVKVQSVNTYRLGVSSKRKTSKMKKVMITLKPGNVLVIA